jgi:hypothetical protein
MSIVDPGNPEKRIVNGWMITREKAPELWKTSGYNDRTHLWKVKGFYGLNDVEASEIKFQDLIEGICTAFRSKYNLNNTVQSIYVEFGPLARMGGIQLDSIQTRVFGSVLCHTCDMSLATMTLESRS